tara:strand:- start:124 stop:1410 length:1287 start_codon:yes stop_codon:yes gene_type:complete
MEKVSLGKHFKKDIELSFDGEEVSTDGGLLLVDKINKELRLTDQLSATINDTRVQSQITHTISELVKQRVYGIAAGYEDLNDHKQLRKDTLLKLLSNNPDDLGSPSTLCRLEKMANPTIKDQDILVTDFLNSYKQPPESICLDFDPTDVILYGDQEFKKYHGYYKDYCYLPLIVTCNNHLLVAYLRTSSGDGAKHVLGVLNLLVKRIRKDWPGVQITFRSDSGLCRDRTLRWCEKNNVEYIVGLTGNSRLYGETEVVIDLLAKDYAIYEQSQKVYTEFEYQAGSWDVDRRVISKIEYNNYGTNIRFVVTNNTQLSAQQIYQDEYCKRGDMENRIKEFQGDLFADRLSCHRYKSNQFRMLLSAVAYTLMLKMKNLINDSVIPYCGTVRLKLIKVATIIRTNSRKVYIQVSKNFPYLDLFKKAVQKLGFG